MDHSKHDMPKQDDSIEYLKFAGVMAIITALSWFHASAFGMSLMQFLESFMGVFFVVFASFKLYNLKEFAYGFKSYETMKDKSVAWGYAYPFIQIIFGVVYLVGFGSRFWDGVIFLWSSFGAYVVWLTLRKKGDVHCLCLGNVINLPLSTISFVEDFGMSTMALAMFILR